MPHSSLIFVHKGNYLAHYMHNNNHLAGIAIGSNCLCNLFPLAKILSEQKKETKDYIALSIDIVVGLKIPQNSRFHYPLLIITYLLRYIFIRSFRSLTQNSRTKIVCPFKWSFDENFKSWVKIFYAI